MKKDKYSNYGWLPANIIQPTNNNYVAIIVLDDPSDECSYHIEIGFYENKEWSFDGNNRSDKGNRNETKVEYWFPLPAWY